MTVRIDATLPQTTDGSDPALAADGDSAWRRTGQTVSLAATDAGGSGLAATYYTLDGEQHDYAGPFAVSGDGSHEITWWSTDAAGNTEAAHTGYVNIWGTAPQTSASAVVSAAGEGWRTSGPQPVSLTATGGHGAVTVHYVLDGVAQADAAGEATFDVAGDGSHELEYWATDELGNEETHHTGRVNIDTLAPATTDDYAGGSAWQTGPVSFTLEADDATSGVAGTTWTVDGGATHSGTDVLVTGDGEHTVTYASTDEAGNAETAHSVTVRIDAGAPATADDAPAGWRTADTTVTLTPKDAFSGMTGGHAATTWELDGGATQTGTSVLVGAPSDHSGDGARTITYRSTDAAGNGGARPDRHRPRGHARADHARRPGLRPSGPHRPRDRHAARLRRARLARRLRRRRHALPRGRGPVADGHLRRGHRRRRAHRELLLHRQRRQRRGRQDVHAR